MMMMMVKMMMKKNSYEYKYVGRGVVAVSSSGLK